jgi:hypothetical protein
MGGLEQGEVAADRTGRDRQRDRQRVRVGDESDGCGGDAAEGDQERSP